MDLRGDTNPTQSKALGEPVSKHCIVSTEICLQKTKCIQTAVSSINFRINEGCNVLRKIKSQENFGIKSQDILRNEIMEWYHEVFKGIINIENWSEKLMKLSRRLSKPEEEKKLKDKIKNYIKRMPSQLPDDEETKKFREQLPDNIIRELKKMYLKHDQTYSSPVHRTELHYIKENENKIKNLVKHWLKCIPIKKIDYLDRPVKREDIFNVIINRLEPLTLDKPNCEKKHKKKLKHNILDILNDIPIETASHNKRSYSSGVADILIDELLNVDNKNKSKVEKHIPCSMNEECLNSGQKQRARHIPPSEKEIHEFVEEELYELLTKSRIGVCSKRISIVKKDLTEILVDAIKSLEVDVDKELVEDICVVLQNLGKLSKFQTSHFTNTLICHLKDMFYFRNHELNATGNKHQHTSKYNCVPKLSKSETYLIMYNTSYNRTFSNGYDSTDINRERVMQGKLEIGMEVYIRQLIDEINEWLLSLSNEIPLAKEESFRELAVKDLAEDIAERKKYLNANPSYQGNDEKEMDNLKYQIFKWINKLIGEENTVTLNHAPELMQRIRSIPVPTSPNFQGNMNRIQTRAVLPQRLSTCCQPQSTSNTQVYRNSKKEKILIRLYEDIIDDWIDGIASDGPEKQIFMNSRNEYVQDLSVRLLNLNKQFLNSPDNVITNSLQKEITNWLKSLPMKHDTAIVDTSHLRNLIKSIQGVHLNDELDEGEKQGNTTFMINQVEGAILDWLKTLPLYRNRNELDKRKQEQIIIELAKKMTKCPPNADEEIICYIKILPMDTKEQMDDVFIQHLAKQLKQHLKYLKVGEISASDFDSGSKSLEANLDLWLQTLPLKIISNEDKTKLEQQRNDFIQTLKTLRSAGKPEEEIKDEIISFIKTLPLDTSYKIQPYFLREAAENLIRKLLAVPIVDILKKMAPKSCEIIKDVIVQWSNNLPLLPVHCPKKLEVTIDKLALKLTDLKTENKQSLAEESEHEMRDVLRKYLSDFPIRSERKSERYFEEMISDLMSMLRDVHLFKRDVNMSQDDHKDMHNINFGLSKKVHISCDKSRNTEKTPRLSESTLDATACSLDFSDESATNRLLQSKLANTSDFAIEQISSGDINTNVDIYVQQLVKEINVWLNNLHIDITQMNDENIKQVVIRDLASDIADRHKYLELNTSSRRTETDELEHLKYMIFKWINKLVGEENQETIHHANELMQRIQSIPVPMLVKPHDTGTSSGCCQVKSCPKSNENIKKKMGSEGHNSMSQPSSSNPTTIFSGSSQSVRGLMDFKRQNSWDKRNSMKQMMNPLFTASSKRKMSSSGRLGTCVSPSNITQIDHTTLNGTEINEGSGFAQSTSNRSCICGVPPKLGLSTLDSSGISEVSAFNSIQGSRLGETSDFDIEQISPDDLNANIENYTQQLVTQIDEWLHNLHIQTPPMADQSVRQVVVRDLAGDITDRHKYLELNSSSRPTDAEELEHLKYMIFKWINKLVGEENQETIHHANELMQRIQSVPVPMLVKPHDIGTNSGCCQVKSCPKSNKSFQKKIGAEGNYSISQPSSSKHTKRVSGSSQSVPGLMNFRRQNSWDRKNSMNQMMQPLLTASSERKMSSPGRSGACVGPSNRTQIDHIILNGTGINEVSGFAQSTSNKSCICGVPPKFGLSTLDSSGISEVLAFNSIQGSRLEETSDISIEQISPDDLNANIKNYTQQLVTQIDEWLNNLHIQIPEMADQSVRQVVVRDLAGDIADRHKYLELNSSSRPTDAEELEHLKYMIFKWINKLVGEENQETIHHANELMQRIQSVPVPMLVKPHDIGTDSQCCQVQSCPKSNNSTNLNQIPDHRALCLEGNFRVGQSEKRRFSSHPQFMKGPIHPANRGLQERTSQIIQTPSTNSTDKSSISDRMGTSGFTSILEREPFENLEIIPKGMSEEKVKDYFKKTFWDRVQTLPLELPPDQQNLETAWKEDICSGIWDIFNKLKCNVNEGEYTFFEIAFEDELDKLLKVIPKSTSFQNYKKVFKALITHDVLNLLKYLNNCTDTWTLKNTEHCADDFRQVTNKSAQRSRVYGPSSSMCGSIMEDSRRELQEDKVCNPEGPVLEETEKRRKAILNSGTRFINFEDIPKDMDETQLEQYFEKIFWERVQALPIELTPEQAQYESIARKAMVNGIWEIFCKLKSNPDYEKDYVYFEVAFDDELDKLLEMLPLMNKLQSYKPTFKSLVAHDASNMLHYLHSIQDTPSFRSTLSKLLQLRMNAMELDIDANIPDKTLERFQLKQTFDISSNTLQDRYSKEIADEYILYTTYKEEDPMKANIYRQRLIKTLDAYCDYQRKLNKFDINKIANFRNQFIAEVFKILENIPIPKDETIKDEAEEILLIEELNKWYNGLPIIKCNNEIIDCIRIRNLEKLAHKLAKLEKKMKHGNQNAEHEMYNEVSIFLDNPVILPRSAQDNKDAIMITLLNRLKNKQQLEVPGYDSIEQEKTANSTLIDAMSPALILENIPHALREADLLLNKSEPEISPGVYRRQSVNEKRSSLPLDYSYKPNSNIFKEQPQSNQDVTPYTRKLSDKRLPNVEIQQPNQICAKKEVIESPQSAAINIHSPCRECGAQDDRKGERDKKTRCRCFQKVRGRKRRRVDGELYSTCLPIGFPICPAFVYYKHR